ncbi:Phosphocarrier protein HPr [Treponema phagedenis]|uniref:Phosphocarrier protein HPr n=2 Tax=Treponema phagedenis TaxID=162 RepID=A0A0B7GXP8_TREPH|nr:Phosphocarrier protein HPr [Treponema phagedenis]
MYTNKEDKMKTFTYTITDPIGIHARPAGKLVALTKTFSSKITISGNDKTADGKRMIAIMSLGIKQGTPITITIEGDDESAAAKAIEDFLKENL